LSYLIQIAKSTIALAKFKLHCFIKLNYMTIHVNSMPIIVLRQSGVGFMGNMFQFCKSLQLKC